MKRYSKIAWVALLFSGLAFTACQDELGSESIKIVPGDEIQFGATAHFENGNSGSTRTEYGDISGNKIEVNWVAGQDRLQIASPHTAGTEVAEYKVINATGGTDNVYTEESTAETLERIGDAGLQWTNNVDYEFYAMYPSHNQLAEVVEEIDVKEVGLKLGVDEDGNQMGSMVGFLPTSQNPAAENIPTDFNAEDDKGNKGYVIKPDMRYAYMVAKEFYTVPDDGKIDPNDPNDLIQLKFSSLVTALQFDITANTIGLQADGSQEIKITSLRLRSDENQICGKFNYTYPKGEDEDVLTGGTFVTANESTGWKEILMSLGQGVTITKDQFLDVTFFLLPSVDVYAAKDLTLTINYVINGQLQSSTARINRDLMPRKKYFFKDVYMPAIEAGLTGSNWWAQLPLNTYFSQISIPVAGNVFSNSYREDNYHTEQITDYMTLWNQGVRGFELVTGSGTSAEEGSATTNLGTCHFVCGEAVLSNGITFDEAFTNLVNAMKSGNSQEPLILICKYHAVAGGYVPQTYVTKLIDYFESKITDGTVERDDFVQITSGTTVGDVSRKIAVIIRPGDDDYMRMYAGSMTANTTKDLNLTATNGNSWGNRVMLIQDWGVAYDRWDRRYANAPRNATWSGYSLVENRNVIENMLYAMGDADGPLSTYSPWEAVALESTADMFQHEVTDFAGKAYIHEWARVVPSMLHNEPLRYDNEYSDSYYLWFKWPESITEKKRHIDKLFAASVGTKGNTSCEDLYINVLSGYYITPDWDKSIAPFKLSFSGTVETTGTMTRYTPKFASSTSSNDGEEVYIRFASALDGNSYLYRPSYYSYVGVGGSTASNRTWTLIGDKDEFILKNGNYYVSGISTSNRSRVTLSDNVDDAKNLKLVERQDGYYEIHFIEKPDANVNHVVFNQDGGATGQTCVWDTGDNNNRIYFTAVNDPQGTEENVTQTVTVTITPRGQGNGGNYAALAADLNTYVYGILSGTEPLSSTQEKLPQGPWGLVVINYINADEEKFRSFLAGEFNDDLRAAGQASTDLVRLIVENNFGKFNLVEKEDARMGLSSDPVDSTIEIQ